MLDVVVSRVLRRTAVAAAVLTYPITWVVRAAWGLPTALGASQRQLRPTVTASEHFYDGKFHNTLPTPALKPANARDGLLRQWHEQRHNGHPGADVPLTRDEFPVQAGELAGARVRAPRRPLGFHRARGVFGPGGGGGGGPAPPPRAP